MTGPLLELQEVTRVFPDDTTALRDVSLQVQQGDFTVLLGASGSGKSTILRLVAGLDQPTSGQVIWGAGRPPRLGYVFQAPALLPWATVWDNVALPQRLKAAARDDGAIRQALELVGLDSRADARPAELSGGMQMRVSIARALVADPQVLLLDEPFSALDEITRHRLGDLLHSLWQGRGLTVLLVTHSIAEAAFHASQAVVLASRPGRVFARHSMDAARPRSRFGPAFGAHCEVLNGALEAAMAED